MTAEQQKEKILKTLEEHKNNLIEINNLYLNEIKIKGQKKQLLEKYHHTAGQISYINTITSYINLYVK